MRETVVLVIGGVAAFALQSVLAPNIAILGAMPNFALAFVATSAMLRRSDDVVVVAFALGLATDLSGGGTVGVSAALFTLASFISSRASALLGNETVSASLLVSMAASMIAEAVYAFFYVATAGVPAWDALVLRALPCALYDCAVVLIVMPVLSHVFSRGASPHAAPESSTIRLR